MVGVDGPKSKLYDPRMIERVSEASATASSAWMSSAEWANPDDEYCGLFQPHRHTATNRLLSNRKSMSLCDRTVPTGTASRDEHRVEKG